MKSVVAIFLIAWCGCAQADVYKWTDKQGEVHFGETPPTPDAEKVMTQEQIQRTENADRSMRQALPPAPADAGRGIDAETQNRIEECQRFKSQREEFLLATDKTGLATSKLIGYNIGYVMRENESGSGLMGYDEIEAGIRKYCRE